MIAGCFVLHLYCENPDCTEPMFESQRAPETRAKAYAEARKYGWQINARESKAYCPVCKKLPGKKNW